MNILDLTLTNSTNVAEFTSGTINFLQLSWKGGFNAAFISMIGPNYQSSKVYIVWGCNLSVVAGNNVISDGCIFYGGEFFDHPQETLIGTSGTIIGNLLTTPYTTAYGGDPMQFSITGSSNAHNIRTVQFVYGTTGTGTISGNSASNYLNMIFIQNRIETTASTLNGSSIDLSRSRTILHGTETGSATYSLSPTSAKVGVKVTHVIPTGGGTLAITLSDGIGTGWVIDDSAVSVGGYTHIYIEIEYLGLSSGLNYVKINRNYFAAPL